MLRINAVRIKNFRSIEDSGYIALKKYNILIGSNSSGKSTFLRFFPLIRQTVESQLNASPLLWLGHLVDFGSFGEMVTDNKLDKKIKVGFSISNDENTPSRYYHITSYLGEEEEEPFWANFKELKVEIEMAFKQRTYVSSLLFSYDGCDGCDEKLELFFDDSTNLIDIIYNDESFFDLLKNKLNIGLNVSQNGFFPEIMIASTLEKNNEDEDAWLRGADWGEDDMFLAMMEPIIKPFLNKNITKKILYIKYKIRRICSDVNFMTNLENIQTGAHLKWMSALVENLFIGSGNFTTLKFLSFCSYLPFITRMMNFLVEERFSGGSLSYTHPFRAIALRYYRQQELKVDEIDSRGENLAVFFNSLSNNELQEFNIWSKNIFGFEVVAKESAGHIQIKIKTDGAIYYNITDVGFGVSQVLPIIAQSWLLKNKKVKKPFRSRMRIARSLSNRMHIFAIEQPELHLHPKMQSRFVNMLSDVDSDSNYVSWFVETHSESIVNRLGEMIASKKIDEDDVQILIFDKKNNRTVIERSYYDERGYLKNWPIGFFDY